MPELTPPLLALLAGCLLLGVATRRYWQALFVGRDSARRGVMAVGVVLLALSVNGFRSHYGWEIGLAWFVLWFAIAALFATLWISLRPRTSIWAGSLLCALAFVTWIV